MTDTTKTETKGELAVRLHREAGKCAASVLPYNSWHSHLCDRKGAPEPATRKKFDWSTGDIKDVPNVNRTWVPIAGDVEEPYEGQLYCKQHSPSGRAQKDAERYLQTWEEAQARWRMADRQRAQLDADIDLVRRAISEAPDAPVQAALAGQE